MTKTRFIFNTKLGGKHAFAASRTPNRFAATARNLCVLMGSLLLASCASLNSATINSTPNEAQPGSETSTSVSPVDRSIAMDIVKSARQIFPPINSTLQFASSNDPLMQYFVQLFANEGYGVQRVSADQGSNLFSYQREEEQIDDTTLVRFNATIGVVTVARDYTVPRVNTISPASPVRVSGTRAPIEVADRPTGRFVVTDPAYSTVEYVASLNLADQAPPVISLITGDLVNRVAERGTRSTSLQALNSNRVEITNLFYTNQSNFSSILDDYDQIEQQIVVFGNDSMVLGNTNKQLIDQFVEQRVKDNDLISLVGCSNGPTALEIGNEGLALGRAERVTQALLSRGVSRDRILDEGCWAPVSARDKYPSRGVVLEVWRKQS